MNGLLYISKEDLDAFCASLGFFPERDAPSFYRRESDGLRLSFPPFRGRILCDLLIADIEHWDRGLAAMFDEWLEYVFGGDDSSPQE